MTISVSVLRSLFWDGNVLQTQRAHSSFHLRKAAFCGRDAGPYLTAHPVLKVQRQRSWAFSRPCRGHQQGPGDGVLTQGKGRLLQTALSAAHIKCVVRTAAVPASEANTTFAGSLPVGSGLWEPIPCWTTLKDGASALGLNR